MDTVGRISHERFITSFLNRQEMTNTVSKPHRTYIPLSLHTRKHLDMILKFLQSYRVFISGSNLRLVVYYTLPNSPRNDQENLKTSQISLMDLSLAIRRLHRSYIPLSPHSRQYLNAILNYNIILLQ